MPLCFRVVKALLGRQKDVVPWRKNASNLLMVDDKQRTTGRLRRARRTGAQYAWLAVSAQHNDARVSASGALRTYRTVRSRPSNGLEQTQTRASQAFVRGFSVPPRRDHLVHILLFRMTHYATFSDAGPYTSEFAWGCVEELDLGSPSGPRAPRLCLRWSSAASMRATISYRLVLLPQWL